MFKYVAQKDAHGCAVACLSMITEYSYDYIKKYYSAKDFTKSGIDFFDYMEFLVDHGYSCNWMWPTTQSKGLNKLRKKWPPELWADINIIIVLQHSDLSHAIVEKDGNIFDPLNKSIKSLDAYKSVSQVIGIYENA